MADKQAQALERLTSKLTALRKTLRGEERQMLDAMVLAAQSEVTAHSSKVSRAIPTKISDVEMHMAGVRQIDAKPAARPQSRLSITLSDGNYRVTIL